MKNEKSASLLNGIVLILAGVINAVGVTLLLYPSQIIDGGISGLSLFLSHVTSVNYSIFIVCLNIPFFIIGFRRMGAMFFIRSIIAICVYSLMAFVFTKFDLQDKVYVELIKEDIFLCAIFGGMISGIGSGLTIRSGGAIDGIDVMAVIFAKKIGITVGQFVMAFNIIMYIIASIVLKDLRISLYSTVSYAIGLKAVDFVVNGFDKCKAVNIITEKGEELSEVLSKHLGRGITLIKAKGYYSREAKTMMYCVVNRFEVIGIKKLIKSVDKNAFVTVSEISDIMGTEIKGANPFKRKKRAYNARDKEVIIDDGTPIDKIRADSVREMSFVSDSDNIDKIVARQEEKIKKKEDEYIDKLYSEDE